MNTIIFACSTLRKELLAAMKENNNHTPIFFLPREVHTDPKFLHTYVQDKIDRFCQVDRIVICTSAAAAVRWTDGNHGGNCDSTDAGTAWTFFFPATLSPRWKEITKAFSLPTAGWNLPVILPLTWINWKRNEAKKGAAEFIKKTVRPYQSVLHYRHRLL